MTGVWIPIEVLRRTDLNSAEKIFLAQVINFDGKMRFESGMYLTGLTIAGYMNSFQSLTSKKLIDTFLVAGVLHLRAL